MLSDKIQQEYLLKTAKKFAYGFVVKIAPGIFYVLCRSNFDPYFRYHRL